MTPAELARLDQAAAQADEDARRASRALGTGIVVALAAALITTGLVIAWVTPPLSGGTIAAAALVAAGGGLLMRLVHVAAIRGRRDRRPRTGARDDG